MKVILQILALRRIKQSEMNLFAYDITDEKILLNSINAFKLKDQFKLVEDVEVQYELLNNILSFIRVHNNTNWIVQNLFELTLPKGRFFITQLLEDRQFPVSHKSGQRIEREYDFYICCTFKVSVDLGRTIIQEETKSDKLLKKFWIRDIEIGDNIRFNEKYKIQTSSKEQLEKLLTDKFINALNKVEGLILNANRNEVLICFQDTIDPQQSKNIERLIEQIDHVEK